MDNIESKPKPKENLEGYEDFSKYISSDAELSIYRRFDTLAARNLLYLQGELQALEAQLQRLDNEDRNDIEGHSSLDKEKKRVLYAAKAWEAFYHESNPEGRQKRKMGIVLKIRGLMEQYEEALLRRSRLLSLEPPAQSSRDAFVNWFRHRKPFLGSGWHLLDDETDIVALKTDTSPDRLSGLIRRFCGYMLRERRHEHPESWGPVYYFPLARVTWIVSILSVIIAGVLLIGAITSLYFVHSPERRLGLAGFFTGLFTASVGLLTNARRPEVFTATAAYAAVLVVYLSGSPA